MKKSIKERRLDAIYNFKNCSNSTQRDELLELLLAMATHAQIKEAVEQLNIPIPKK